MLAPWGKVSMEAVFKPFPMRGHPMRVSCMPYSYLSSADEKTSPEDPRKRWDNYIGYQVLRKAHIKCDIYCTNYSYLKVDWIRVACQKLDCTLEFSNPESLLWGSIENGSFTGHFKEMADNKVDLITGGNILTFYRSLVSLEMHIYFTS